MYNKKCLKEIHMASIFSKRMRKDIVLAVRQNWLRCEFGDMAKSILSTSHITMYKMNKSPVYGCTILFPRAEKGEEYGNVNVGEFGFFLYFMVNEEKFCIHIPKESSVYNYKRYGLLWDNDK